MYAPRQIEIENADGEAVQYRTMTVQVEIENADGETVRVMETPSRRRSFGLGRTSTALIPGRI